MFILPLIHERFFTENRPSFSAKKPVAIFNMAHKDQDDGRREQPKIVSGAALSLAGMLRSRGLATPVFMKAPFVQGGQLVFPPGLSRARPLVFLLSLYDRLFTQTQAEVDQIRDRFPRATIILGGPGVNLVNYLPRLKDFFPEVNVFVKGDGEYTACRLFECFKNEKIDINRLSELEVKGVYATVGDLQYLDNRVNVLSDRELDELPGLTAFPDLAKDIKRLGLLDIHTSRSCKYRCVFCSHKYHAQPIYWSAERIIQELKRIKEYVERGELPKEARKINFTDDDFFQDKARAIKFLSLVAADPALKHCFQFSFQASVGSFFSGGEIDGGLLAHLRQIKVNKLSLGTDGFSDQMLRLFNKSGYKWRQAKELIARLSLLGFKQVHYIILTHPQMDAQLFYENLQNIITAISANPGFVFKMNFLLAAYEGTRIMEEVKKYNPDLLIKIKGYSGEIKYLPTSLPFASDPLFASAILETLRQPFKTVSQMKKDRKEALKQGAAGQSEAKLIAKMVRWRRKQPVDLAIWQAIQSENQYVVLTALRTLFEETKRAKKQI